MKRTDLVLEENLLAEATRVSGEKTDSAAANRAIADFLRGARGVMLSLPKALNDR